jgi:glycine dehydrogenase subunit 1
MAGFVPSNRKSRAQMLSDAGLPPPEQLFDSVPQDLRLDYPEGCPQLDGPLNEPDLIDRLRAMADRNLPAADHICFLGAGAYDHYQPAAIRHLLLRQEFYTSYTPYQPEVSQGTLQGIFEFQSLVCRMTDLDIANSSMYDGATAAAEALLMACRATGRNRIIVADTVHPHTREIIATYLPPNGGEVDFLPAGPDGSWADALAKQPPDEQTAAVLVQSPNFFGLIEDLPAIAALAHQAGALAIASCDLLSLAVLKTPGQAGMDIAVGDAQSLGLPLSFGGPYAGYLAARQSLLRRMPGRICGETVDRHGRRTFVLTIQAREQHIRREKATSNICTNQALCALAVTMQAALLGANGLVEAAGQSARKATSLRQALCETGWFLPVHDRPFFREFAVRLNPETWNETTGTDLNRYLATHGIIGGLDLANLEGGSGVPGGWLLAATEKRRRSDINRLIDLIGAYRRDRGWKS